MNSDTIAGEEWNANGGGIIESVDEANQIIYLKLEPGELAEIDLDDICKGKFNDSTGFKTSFFRITEQLGDSSFKYVLRGGYTFHPCKAMHFVSYGNFTNLERQKSSYSTQSYTRYLKGVNNWEITKDMIAMQFGDMSNLKLLGIDMTGYSAYLRNIYLTGVIKQLSSDGVTESLVPCFKGEWTSGKYWYYDEVTHNGSTWLCISDQPTTQEPSNTATDWLKLISKGDQGESTYNLSIAGVSSTEFIREDQAFTRTATAYLYYGMKDVTETIHSSGFVWKRISENTLGDDTWNVAHLNIGNMLTITEEDVIGDTRFELFVYSNNGILLTSKKI